MYWACDGCPAPAAAAVLAVAHAACSPRARGAASVVAGFAAPLFARVAAPGPPAAGAEAVSYTHLTLPTICS
eukprot:2494187-Alexandrium_andersonii.AAC.1